MFCRWQASTCSLSIFVHVNTSKRQYLNKKKTVTKSVILSYVKDNQFSKTCDSLRREGNKRVNSCEYFFQRKKYSQQIK